MLTQGQQPALGEKMSARTAIKDCPSLENNHIDFLNNLNPAFREWKLLKHKVHVLEIWPHKYVSMTPDKYTADKFKKSDSSNSKLKDVISYVKNPPLFL